MIGTRPVSSWRWRLQASLGKRGAKVPPATQLEVLGPDRQLQRRAIALGCELVQGYEGNMERCAEVATKLEVNRTAAVGIVVNGHLTPAHQHALGVLHLCLGGKKRFLLWRPSAERRLASKFVTSQKPDEVLPQLPGDLIWFPPFWWHLVTTDGGHPMGDDVAAQDWPLHWKTAAYSAHWVSWCLPCARVPAAIRCLKGDFGWEGQSNVNRGVKARLAVQALMEQNLGRL